MPIITGTANGETLNGTPDADSIYGLGGDDSLFGFAGSDLLDGGAGRDSMQGGAGDDTYVVNDSLDAIIESSGQGDDVVRSTVSYTLGAAVSIETMTTLNAASTAGLNFTGNEFGQSIYGNAGANILNGGGGADFLVGLAGNDHYFIDNAADTVAEVAGEGEDTVHSTVSYTLAPGVMIETMTTMNAAGTDPINFTGNVFGQTIYGNAGVNVLNGGGHNGGRDYLFGLGGDDHYIVDSQFNVMGGVIGEVAGEGDDSVHVSGAFALDPGASIETITTTNELGGVDYLTGNEFGQSIYGDAGRNQLTGGGGADYLVGLGGNDLLNGGTGADFLLGGDGADWFQFSFADSRDHILDFTSGTDKIDLGDFVTSENFQFLGTGNFTGSPGQGRYADGLFQLDVNGDGTAELEMSLSGPLVIADFEFQGDPGWYWWNF